MNFSYIWYVSVLRPWEDFDFMVTKYNWILDNQWVYFIHVSYMGMSIPYEWTPSE